MLTYAIFAISTVAEAVVSVNDCIYIFKSDDDRNLCYNILEKQWHDLEGFVISRYNYAAVGLEGNLYVLGGIYLFTED